MHDNNLSVVTTKTLWTGIAFALPLIISIAGTYGTFKYASGDTQRSLLESERRIQDTIARVERLEQGRITKDDLNDLKIDIRELRNAIAGMGRR